MNLRAAPAGWLERLLSPFADVREGEGRGAVLLALNAFLLLAAYYVIKPVREALILTGGGAEVKSYSSAGQALLLLFLIPAYGRFASRVSRISLITWVTLFFLSNLILFYALGVAKTPLLGVAFFLWVGIFNVMIIAQFWGFANDIYTPEQGKRLFAIVAIGSNIGAIFGSWIAKPLIGAVGVYLPLLIAAAMLGVCIVLSRRVHANAGAARGAGGQAVAADAPIGPAGGFQLIARQRYLLWIALLVLLLNAVNTTGEYILGRTVRAAAQQALAAVTVADPDAFQKRFIGSFYADFFFWVNLVGALTQAFVVSRVMKWFGVRAALFVLPLIALGGYALLATVPVLGLIRTVKIVENATDYSLNNTARHALFLPTSREAKYKAKAAIDSFFWRMGDLVSAGLVFVGSLLHLATPAFAAVNFVLALAWVWVVVRIASEHRALTGDERETAGGMAKAATKP
jgi:ATP:ADP antiporter, AAA family